MNRANTLRTTLELEVMLNTLEDLQKLLYHQEYANDVARLLQTTMPAKPYEFLNTNYDLTDIPQKEELARILTELKTKLEALSQFHITIAVDPTDQLIEEIFNFVREHWGDNYILDIDIDRDILGGSIIVVDGHYYDFSLEKKIDRYLKDYA